MILKNTDQYDLCFLTKYVVFKTNHNQLTSFNHQVYYHPHPERTK